MPVVFGFPEQVKVDAALQARAAVAALFDGSAGRDELLVVARIGMYCVAMCEHMIKTDAVEDDGLADAAEAVSAGSDAVAAIVNRFSESGKVLATDAERAPLDRLADAYEAIFNTATRRESARVLATLPRML